MKPGNVRLCALGVYAGAAFGWGVLALYTLFELDVVLLHMVLMGGIGMQMLVTLVDLAARTA